MRNLATLRGSPERWFLIYPDLLNRVAHELVTVSAQIVQKKGNFSGTPFSRSEKVLGMSEIERISMNYQESSCGSPNNSS